MSLLQEPEETEIYGKKKTTKSEFLIADHTKGVVLTVWEDDFDKKLKLENPTDSVIYLQDTIRRW